MSKPCICFACVGLVGLARQTPIYVNANFFEIVMFDRQIKAATSMFCSAKKWRES